MTANASVRQRIISRIAAAQKEADALKQAAQAAKAELKRAKKKFKQEKKFAKVAKKAVKALRAELKAATAPRKPAPKRAPKKKAATTRPMRVEVEPAISIPAEPPSGDVTPIEPPPISALPAS